jgi:thiol:disulfide interchange protein DsbD
MMDKASMSGRINVGFFILVLAMLVTVPPAQAQADMFDTGTPPGEPASNLVEAYSALSISSAQPGRTYLAATLISIAPDWHINSAHPHQDWLIPAELTIDTITEVTPHSVVYPKGVEAFLLDETMSVYNGRVILYYEVTIGDNAPEGEVVLPVQFTYQACNDKECQPPQTINADLRVTIGEEGEPTEPEIFSGVNLQHPEQPASSPPPGERSELQQLIDQYGFWGYIIALGLAFITGLLLSFSPCTYPMIPITVSIFAGQERGVGRGFILSLFYVGSMAVMYGLMGLVVSLVGGVFGAWLASPPVVIAIAIIFFIFSLSMFGLYEINVPSSVRQRLGTAKGGGGVLSVIILGIVAALVVSPCVGPFVAGILLYIATTGSPLIGFFVLFVFALGLGTFYIIIGTFSSAVTKLPRAGEWMDSVKKFFGFVLLLMALYFLRTIIPASVTAVLTGLLLMALGIFGGGLDRLTSDSPFFLRLKKFIGILALLFGVYFLMGTVLQQGILLPSVSQWLPVSSATETPEETHLIPWETDLEAGLVRAKAENLPVLIDTWATWCANCRVLDKKTFHNPEVVAAMTEFVPIRVQLEKADSPETRQFMERFGLKVYTLPTVLLLDSSGTTQTVMKGVVGPDKMLAAMQKVH